MAQSPVLLIGGAAPLLLKGKGALQDIDQLAVVRPLCKYVCSVRHVRDIEHEVSKTIAIAKSGTPGPVFLEMALDVLWPYEITSKEILSMASVKGLVGRAISWYVKHHLTNTFVGMPSMESPVKPLPVQIPEASNSDVSTVASWLKDAKRP